MRLSFLGKNRFHLLQYFDSDITIPKYTIIWKNWDGSIIETDEKVLEGGKPAFNSDIPTKPATELVRYEFDGWDPEITNVSGDTVYTAKFKEIPITHQINWLNYDGSIIKMEEIQAGTKPAYSGTTPTKPSAAQYRYEFAGWTPTIVEAYSDASYTAVFNELPNTVIATFIREAKDGGGTLYTDSSVAYNTAPEYKGNNPTTTRGSAPNFTFDHWEPELGPITENTTFVAKFKDNRSLVIQFLDRTMTEYDASVDIPIPTYTVTWENYDGTVLQKDEDFQAGKKPSYQGSTPLKPSTPGHDYEFIGWSPEITIVSKDVTYVAQFKDIPVTFKATFVLADEDGGGTVKEQSGISYGGTPTMPSETPTTIRGDSSTYAFDGWTPEVGPIYADTVYTAKFKELGSLTIRFLERTLTEYEG